MVHCILGVYLSKQTTSYFDDDAVLLPEETICMDEWATGFPGNTTLSERRPRVKKVKDKSNKKTRRKTDKEELKALEDKKRLRLR